MLAEITFKIAKDGVILGTFSTYQEAEEAFYEKYRKITNEVVQAKKAGDTFAYCGIVNVDARIRGLSIYAYFDTNIAKETHRYTISTETRAL